MRFLPALFFPVSFAAGWVQLFGLKSLQVGIPLTQVRADSDGTVGRTIVFRRLPPSPSPRARQTTKDDGLPHGTAGTQPE
jgi:hypothetical protein